MPTLPQLESDILALPENQRVELLNRVFKAAEPVADPSVGAAWEDEIKRRIERVDSGESKMVPAGDVFEEIDRRIG
ncbi:addiction module protein [Sulfuriroseicoccus oceanibius]|uniref:Addiction module protein n=1 Tax=Sulfuriroseicoccus oceanibius TaxID=2707525 RepID=A0A6B3L8F4_9BACT|nr:addiction module protein [Sulfuriroseicoccus oceanibius]QQL46113.1 addiction module protein [Sulfuriroseicoccus oceanibius]